MTQSNVSVHRNRWWFILLVSILMMACGENQETNETIKESKKKNLVKPVEVSRVASIEQTTNNEQFANTEFKILDVSQRDYQGVSSLGIVLSVPLDSRAEFQKYLVLERQDGARVDGAWILSDTGRELFFKNIEPESDYLLTVYANLTARNNKNLGQRYKKNITTQAIKASISFAHDGGILPLSHSRGLPVYSININQVDVDFHRIKDDKILDFLQQWRGGKANYYHLKRYADQAELVYSARFDLAIAKNKRERVVLDINHIKKLKPAGIYLAVMKAPGKYDYRQSVSYFIRSDIGVHVRRYPGQLNAYLRSLVSGEALTDVDVHLLDHNGQQLAQVKSDAIGMVRFDNSLNKARLILTRKDQQLSLVKLTSPALDLSEFNIGQQKYHHNEAFFYAPRDIYRPGEVVNVSLLLRDFDGNRIPDIPLQAQIKRSDGQVVKRFTWKPEQIGYYQHTYELPKHAKTGRWHIEVQLPGEGKGQKFAARQWVFSVEDFLPERMKLTLLETDKGKFIKRNEPLQIPVQGKYLYGAPASGNRLATQVNTLIDQQAIKSLPGFLFGHAQEKNARKSYSLDELELDQQGKAQLEIPSRWQDIESPLAVKVTASLFETGGRAIKRQAIYRLWPADKLIGIRPHWYGNKAKQDPDQENEPGANTLLGFDIINADKTGKLYAAEHLNVTLIRKRRDYYWKYNNSDEWEMEFNEKNYPVLQQRISVTADGRTSLQVPVEWGYYRLEIHNPDTGLTSSVEFNAGGSWYYKNQQARISRPDKINLILDKARYSAGDTAKIIVKSPFPGQGVILVENGNGLLWQKPIALQSNELALTIPINKKWDRHDIYMSVVIFNGPGKENSTNDSVASSEYGAVKRAIGLTHLAMDRKNRQLNLIIDSRQKSQPLSTLPVTVRLEKPDRLIKEDTDIMVTLAAVDVGVLNVSNFVTPDPFAWFFGQRRYTIDSLDMYGNIMDGRKGIVGKHRFGGDMDINNAGQLQKAKTKIVSLFHQPIRFDDHGEALITLDIPDFNGQLRLMAVAFGESSYGHAEQTITIAAPLVTQLSMPLFLAANDESSLTLDVHNLSDQQQKLTAALFTDEVIDIQASKRELTLKHNEKTSLHFAVKSKETFGLADIKLIVRNQKTGADQLFIQRRWQLAIRPAWPAIQRNKQQVIASDQAVNLAIQSDDLMSDTLMGSILISNQPPINLAENLKHLLKYPYGCLEQTTSSSFPWLFASKENMEKLGLQTIKINNQAIDYSKRKQYLARGVQRLSSKQLRNGGFGLWNNQSNEEFWLTAYASHFLLQAKAQNVDVPEAVMKPAIRRLQQYLRSARPGYDYRYSQYPEHLTIAYKAYAAYVLSSIKQAPLGTLRTLFDYHINDAHSGLPLMHLGIALIRQGDLSRGQDAIEQSLRNYRDPHHYLGDYGSILRDLSLMLAALVHFDPSHAGVTKLLYQLQAELSKRKWLSTQERNALFMAGVALKESGQRQWQAIIKTAMGEEKIIHDGDFNYHLNHLEIEQGIGLQSLQQERLYASMDISGYTRQPPKADFQHFNITRTYYNTKGEMIVPEQMAVGELMIVELSLQAKQRIQDALIVDLLPAGFEIENQNLTHSIKLEEYRIGQQTIVDRMDNHSIKYQAWRDDRYVAAIDLKGYGTQRLYYLLRAVTPGIYQVPPPYAEDMYRPYIRAIGETPEVQQVLNRKLTNIKM